MSFSRIQSLRLAAGLEDCSDQLDVLGLTLEVKIDKERGPAAEQEKARLTKLRRDCQSVSQTVFKLHSELEEKQSISSLLQVVEEVEQRKKAEDMRRQIKTQLNQRIQTLRTQKEELCHKKKTLKDMSLLVKDLSDQLNEHSSKMDSEKKFKEKSMMQQVLRDTRQADGQLEDQRELLQIQLMEEKKVHERSVKFLQSHHEELQLQLQQWQQRTRQMKQEKEQQLNSVCCKRTMNLDRLSEMRRKFREMEQVVLEDREEQKKLRRQQAEARAATKLQAWWRGCMVRRGLGSFKKADDNKGKKNKGKKTKEEKKTKKAVKKNRN
ncbi:dynein regulatory complex protein 9 [Cyclopterus lumpus]|uniref:dynein regulatory complex protein 9 n=1 Tax=Cyclopterus lumpus TaxID=8103 RepID=UPI0014872AE5|nr:dynein regulatory complex protein 9 [Cyclopterus lumpus]